MTTDDVVRRAAESAVDRRGRRAMWTSLGVMLAGVLALGAAYLSAATDNADQAEQLTALEQRADANAATAQQLADQVRDLGAVPVVQPSVPGERGPVGPRGADGVGIAEVERGDCSITIRLTSGQTYPVDGLCGASGRDGRSITNAAAVGCDVVLTWSDASTSRIGPLCGPAGSAGRDGRDGVDGQTPPCMSEPDQCRGERGPAGPQGEPGPACPDGYEPTRAVIVTPGSGAQEGIACVRQ